LFEEACTRGYNHCAVLHDLLSRDLASLIHPQHDPAVQRAGRVWVRGDGAMLTDADGKEYIDSVLAPPFVTRDDSLDRIGDILAAATKAVLEA